MENAMVTISLKEYDYMRDFIKQIKGSKTYSKRVWDDRTDEFFIENEELYSQILDDLCEAQYQFIVQKESSDKANRIITSYERENTRLFEEKNILNSKLEFLGKINESLEEQNLNLLTELNKKTKNRLSNIKKWFNK